MKYKDFYEYKQSYMYPANPSGGHEKRVAAVGCRMSNVLFGTGIFQGGQGPEHRAMSIALRTEAYLMIYETIPAQLSDRHGGRISTSKLGSCTSVYKYADKVFGYAVQYIQMMRLQVRFHRVSALSSM